MNEQVRETLRILVVDDCADMRESIMMLLHAWGHEVRTAGDGFACLSLAAIFLPHVVLLDVGLPGMDGYEVARLLRAQTPAQPLHLVTVSGHGLEEDFDRSRRAGCERHLVKPVDLLDLQRMLAGYAEQAQRVRGQEAMVT
jgi:two-component system CheB/CheR fusion protein